MCPLLAVVFNINVKIVCTIHYNEMRLPYISTVICNMEVSFKADLIAFEWYISPVAMYSPRKGHALVVLDTNRSEDGTTIRDACFENTARLARKIPFVTGKLSQQHLCSIGHLKPFAIQN